MSHTDKDTSKFIALILRHKPETIGITLLDKETARTVGARHGKPVIYEVKSGEMHRDGFKFYRSANGVWLTKEVPVKYLAKTE